MRLPWPCMVAKSLRARPQPGFRPSRSEPPAKAPRASPQHGPDHAGRHMEAAPSAIDPPRVEIGIEQASTSPRGVVRATMDKGGPPNPVGCGSHNADVTAAPVRRACQGVLRAARPRRCKGGRERQFRKPDSPDVRTHGPHESEGACANELASSILRKCRRWHVGGRGPLAAVRSVKKTGRSATPECPRGGKGRQRR
jgi:hypothetical protein